MPSGAQVPPPSRGSFEPDDALRTTVRLGSDAHDFKAVVALVDLGARLPARWYGEVAAALAATRVLHAPAPWAERAEARARLHAALRAVG